MTASSSDRECKLSCKSFYCSKKMLKIVKTNDVTHKSFICMMDDAECLGYMCNYAECRERKMNDAGLCLRPIKAPQQTKPQIEKHDIYSKYDYMSDNELDDKLRKKISKKLNSS